jgi:hypothetical protein
MQPANEMTADRGCVLPRELQPVEDAVGFTALDPADGPQAVTLDQHRDRVQQELPLGAQGCKEGPLVETQGLLTGATVIPAFDVAMNFDVLPTDFCKVSASFVIAPSLLVSHRPAPLIRRWGNGNTKTAFHGLRGHYHFASSKGEKWTYS